VKGFNLIFLFWGGGLVTSMTYIAAERRQDGKMRVYDHHMSASCESKSGQIGLERP